MLTTIAIFCPQTGNLSETFVQRHTQLLPENTVVITGNKLKGNKASWHTQTPTLALNEFPFNIIYPFARRLGMATGLNKILVKRFLKKHKVTHALGEYLDYSTQWVSILAQLNIPFFVHSYGYDISENLQNQKWKAAYKNLNSKIVKAIINEGAFVKQRLVDIGIDAAKIFTITSCPIIPNSFIQRTENKTVTLLSSGRMVGKKNPLPMLAAFKKAQAVFPKLKLQVIGDGPLLSQAMSYVNSNELSNAVTFLGAVENNAVIKQMQLADIFISHHTKDPLTGDEEGLPVTILEAMGQGLPIISTRHAAIPECITDGEEGFLVTPEDVDAMADKIILLANDYTARATMGQKAWRTAYENFSWEKEKAALLKLMSINLSE